MKRTLRLRPLLKRLLQLAAILILAQTIVDYRRSLAIPPKTSTALPPNPPNQKIFIASIHWNNESILRSHWIPALLDLVTHLGPQNVFVSVQESGSWDDSKGALRELDAALGEKGVRRRIVLDETTHADEIAKTPAPGEEREGWIRTDRSEGEKELRRVPYLAKLRNLVLEPLEEMAKEGEVFERVLWVGDVVFGTQDVQRLLDTRGGDYAAACSLDFSKPPAFYDTFALRDSDGRAAIMQSWPYFRSRASRDALKASEPVPVTSCWNGIVAMDAAPFYKTPTTPYSTPLRFRGIPDSLATYHLEGSECCLIHTDNPLSSHKGVWLNPNVRVGYDIHAYERVSPPGDNGGKLPPNAWVGMPGVLHGNWENRILRWFTSTVFEDGDVRNRVRDWVGEADGYGEGDGNQESGAGVCLIDEMQVLIANGWAHV